MRKDARSQLWGWVLSAALIAGCQPAERAPGMPALSIDVTPAVLMAPQGLDWSFQRVTSQRLATEQQAHFKRHTLAFPTASTNWSTGPGVALTSIGAAAGDTVPNGPAAAFRTNPADPLYNKLFYLTKNGKFIKLDRSNPGAAGAYTALNLGTTFSRTFITLSPACSRAYLLADNGTLYIVNTITMTTQATVSVSGGYGCAVYVDPFTSSGQDFSDVIYVPGNDGNVTKYNVTATGFTSPVAVSSPTVYPVATSSAAVSGRKIAAPSVALNGVIYVGDQGGNLHVYDTANTANNLTYGVGAPVDTAPAIELQDGTYTLTDAMGTPKSVPLGTPVFAFVTAGSSCFWCNLHDTSITPSLPLRIDDNDAGRKFGYLLDYKYSNTVTTEYIAAVDGGNINTDTAAAPADQILEDANNPSTNVTNWYNKELIPAETNVYDDGTQPAGGPVVSYIRWNSSASYPAGSVVTSAQLSLEAVADQACRVPEIRTTSPTYKGTSTLWASNGFTNANRPAIGSGNVGSYLSGGINAQGNVGFSKNKGYLWDVTSAIPAPTTNYALALVHNAGGDAVLWPWGPYSGATGKKGKAKKAYQVESVRFKNNPLNMDPSAGAKKDARPLLTLSISQTVLPTASIETPPVIDSWNKRVYVYYMNTLFSMDYASPSGWADADPAGTKHTLFNLAYYGDTANNPGGVGGTKPGATFNNYGKFVSNYSAPVPSYDLSAMYVLSRTPSPDGAAPTTWNYALSKFNLPLSATANRMVAGSPTFTAIGGQTVYTGASSDKESSIYMVVDPFTNAGTTGGNVYFALGNGRIYQYDR